MREEVTRRLQFFRLGDLIQGMNKEVTAQKVYQGYKKYENVDLTEASISPSQVT